MVRAIFQGLPPWIPIWASGSDSHFSPKTRYQAVRAESPCLDTFCSRTQWLFKQTRGEETLTPSWRARRGTWQWPGRTISCCYLNALCWEMHSLSFLGCRVPKYKCAPTQFPRCAFLSFYCNLRKVNAFRN